MARTGSGRGQAAEQGIGKLPVDKVTVEYVLKVLKPIWTEKPETASRLRGRIDKVLGWATAMGYRSGDNPAAWNGALGHLLPAISKVQKIEHHKALPYKDVPALMANLMKMDSQSARALAFTILTVARTGETIGATPQEIDRGEKLWVVPPARMKAGREHRVPLIDTAFALLGDPTGKYLFSGVTSGKPLSNMAMLMLLRDLRGGATPFTASGRHSRPGPASRPITRARLSSPVSHTLRGTRWNSPIVGLTFSTSGGR